MIRPTAEKQVSIHFSSAELSCRCGCGKLPEQRLIDNLELMRSIVDAPMRISSGARCAKHNEAVSTTGDNGPHVQGLAADILTSHNGETYNLVAAALAAQATGIGISSMFVHVDWCPRKTKVIWTYA